MRAKLGKKKHSAGQTDKPESMTAKSSRNKDITPGVMARHLDYLLLSPRIWVWFSVPIWWCRVTCNSNQSQGTWLLLLTPEHIRHTLKQHTHTQPNNSSLYFSLNIYCYFCACLSVLSMWMHTHIRAVLQEAKELSNVPELELQPVLSCPTWILVTRTGLWSSRRPRSSPNHWTTSPATSVTTSSKRKT